MVGEETGEVKHLCDTCRHALVKSDEPGAINYCLKSRGLIFFIVDECYDYQDYKTHVDMDVVFEEVINDLVLVNRELLEKILHEFNSLHGLVAVGKCGYSGPGYCEIYDEDMIELDFKELIEEIEEVLDNE